MPEPGTNGMLERQPHINYAPPSELSEGGQSQTERALAEEAMRGRQERYYSEADKLVSNIEALKNAPEVVVDKRNKEFLKDKETLRKEISKSYVKLEHAQIDEIDEVGKYLEDLHNPYPYDSRWSLQFFNQLLKKVNESLRDEESIDVEGRAILKTLKKDVLWSLATTRINEAMGPAYEVYYDGELQMSLLRTMHSEIRAGDFQKAYGAKVKGLELDDNEKQAAIKILGTTENVRTTKDGNKELVGLRERAIELQDSASKWEMATVAVGQKNLEKGFENDDEAGEHYMDIDPVTYRFLSVVFDGKHEPGVIFDSDTAEVKYEKLTKDDLIYTNKEGKTFRVKENTFNPFAMPRSDEKAWPLFQTRMHEITKDPTVVESLQKIKDSLSTTQGDVLDKLIVEEAAKIILNADKQVSKLDALDQESPFTRLTDTVIKTLITLDRGVLASGEMGWHWSYEEEKIDDPNNSGKKIGTGKVLSRKSEFGSLHDDHDVHTVTFWARHVIDYDELADTRSQLLFPSVGSYRKRWFSEPPYFRPTLQEFAGRDIRLLNTLGKPKSENEDMEQSRFPEGILGERNRLENVVGRRVYRIGKEGRNQQKYGKFDTEVAKFIDENVWAFQTPFLSEPGKGSDEYYLSMPMFLPTMIEDINFWRTTTLETPSTKINIENSTKSIWHKRLDPTTKISELDWNNMGRYQYNWFRTNLDQMERWFGPMITPHSLNKMTADEYVKHYSKSSGFAEKEAGKRGRLGSRGSKYGNGVIRAAVLAQNKVLGALHYSNVMSLPKTIELSVKLDEWQNGWIAPWVNTLLDMPDEVRKVKNYGGTAAQSLIFSYFQARRIVESAINHGHEQVGDVIVSLNDIKKNFK